MFSCTFSSKSILSRAHTKDTQFTIKLPVIYAYRPRFSNTIAYPNLPYSAANHVLNIFFASWCREWTHTGEEIKRDWSYISL
jgi:hypothetical protein